MRACTCRASVMTLYDPRERRSTSTRRGREAACSADEKLVSIGSEATAACACSARCSKALAWMRALAGLRQRE